MQGRRAGHAVVMLFGLGAWALLYGLALVPTHFHDGFAQSFADIEPFLCMLAIGLWATQLKGRALGLLPASFALALAGGAVLALAGIVLPGADDGVALSLAVMGVLLVVSAEPRLEIAVVVAAAFGLCHGYAQGAAMPATAEPLPYVLGLVLAAALLQLVGLALGLIAQYGVGRRLLPLGAAALAGLGVSLMLAL